MKSAFITVAVVMYFILALVSGSNLAIRYATCVTEDDAIMGAIFSSIVWPLTGAIYGARVLFGPASLTCTPRAPTP